MLSVFPPFRHFNTTDSRSFASSLFFKFSMFSHKFNISKIISFSRIFENEYQLKLALTNFFKLCYHYQPSNVEYI
jgi:hypothetical protein